MKCTGCGLKIQLGVRGCESEYEFENCLKYWKAKAKALEPEAIKKLQELYPSQGPGIKDGIN